MKTIPASPSESIRLDSCSGIQEPASTYGTRSREWCADVAATGVISQPRFPASVTSARGQCEPGVAEVMAAAGALGVNGTRFATYARLRWGSRWRRDAMRRALALDEIRRYRNDAEGFADKVDNALRLAGRSDENWRCP